MKKNTFQEIIPHVAGNQGLRIPQREGAAKIASYFEAPEPEREIGVVLPVGCGKSGLIALTPFSLKSERTLVIAPNLKIAEQLFNDLKPSNPKAFYLKCDVIKPQDFPEPCEIRGKKTNRADLDGADVVVTNIHQLQGGENKWLAQLPDNYFDLILFDEGHHNVADSWDLLRDSFPNARIVNFSATPVRADGQKMQGPIVYSYSIFNAVENGYVKRLKAIQLNPETLSYVEYEGGKTIEVALDEVIRLAREDANFRRGVLLSEESLFTIVDASIQELNRIREDTQEKRHKIIAAALNYDHCAKVVAAYKARGMRADFVHSIDDQKANEKVLKKLENHELDVIVQVRKLGEGFDHPFLSVAAVCAIFASLSPFAQFVGRIMRVIDQNDPASINNQGSVIFHAGTNVAPRWHDFREFSEADQEYFELLTQNIEFVEPTKEITPEASAGGRRANVEAISVMNQAEVLMKEMPLVENENTRILEQLRKMGVITDDHIEKARQVIKLRPTKQDERLATKTQWDSQIKARAQEELGKRGLAFAGKTLDMARPPKENWLFMKMALDRQINELVRTSSQQPKKKREDFTLDDWALVKAEFENCCEAASLEVFGVS